MTAPPPPAQLEAWPELKQNERIHRALAEAMKRAEYLVQRSWPNAQPANRSQFAYIVTSAIATFHHDLIAPE